MYANTLRSGAERDNAMKKLFCCLLALLLLSSAALAAEMRTGEEGCLRFGAYLYCVEADGLYRLEGTQRAQVCAWPLNPYGGLVSDGVTAWALGEDGEIVRVDLESGAAEAVAQCGADMSVQALVGCVEDTFYLLGDYSEMDAYTLFALNADGVTRVMDGAGSGFHWGDRLVVRAWTGDVGAGWLRVVAAGGAVEEISELAYMATACDGALYYWEGVLSDGGEYWMENAWLYRRDDAGETAIAQTGTGSFSVQPFFDGFGRVILNDQDNICAIIELANSRYTRVEMGDRDHSEWQYDTLWFFDRANGNVYSYGNTSRDLFLEWDGKQWNTCHVAELSPLAENRRNTVVDIYDGIAYCRVLDDPAHLYWSLEL